MDSWTNTLKWVIHYTLLKCSVCLKREGKISQSVMWFVPELWSFLCSSPVWLHHHLCSGIPAGSSPGSAQQYHWDSSWRLQVCHSVEETHACPSHWHRSVWALTAPSPLRCLPHSVCFIFRSKPLYTTVKHCGNQTFSILWRKICSHIICFYTAICCTSPPPHMTANNTLQLQYNIRPNASCGMLPCN